MLPVTFRHVRVLPLANMLAVGASLATLTGCAFLPLERHGQSTVGIVAALSTLVMGSVWAALLRMRTRVALWRWRLPIGWAACAPLAALNAAITCGTLFAADPDRGTPLRFFLGAVYGATFGAIVWLPALLATLVCFGVPLVHAQRLAARGLAREEQGERIVGLVSAVYGIVGGLMAGLNAPVGSFEQALMVSLGTTGALSGLLAAGLASARARRRRVFVAETEAGRVEGYRVEIVPEGKVLVRAENTGEMYRGAERFEAVFELAAEDSPRHPLVRH